MLEPILVGLLERLFELYDEVLDQLPLPPQLKIVINIHAKPIGAATIAPPALVNDILYPSHICPICGLGRL
jgi:hypothetical protein